MRVLHLEASPGWGGQEIRILREAEGLRKRGHEIFLAVEKNGGLVDKAREAGFKVYEVKYKKLFWFISFFQLLFIVLKNRIDILNTHSSSDSWLGGIVARILRKKVIRTRHLSTPIKTGLNSYFLYNVLTDYVVTTCAGIVDSICSQSGKNKAYCSSIPTGVDLENIKYDLDQVQAFREKYKIGKEDFLIGTACFMRSWKGIDDFIEAANMLKNEKNIKWVIIGGGHSEKYIKKAQDLKLENLFFTGYLSPPYNAIAALDVFALLSTGHEGVSQASLQASYLEKPIVGTSTGGIPEVCIDNLTGIRVSNFSPIEVKDAILKLKSAPDLCLSMGKAAKKLVLEKFTYLKMLDRMEEIYFKLLKNEGK